MGLTVGEIIDSLNTSGDRFAARNAAQAQNLGVEIRLMDGQTEGVEGAYDPNTRTLELNAELVAAAQIDPNAALILQGTVAEELQHAWHAHRGRDGIGFLQVAADEARFTPSANLEYSVARNTFIENFVDRGLTDEALSHHQNLIHGPDWPAGSGMAQLDAIIGRFEYGRIPREALQQARDLIADHPDFNYREVLTDDAVEAFEESHGSGASAIQSRRRTTSPSSGAGSDALPDFDIATPIIATTQLPRVTVGAAEAQQIRAVVDALPRGDALFQASGFADVPSIADPFNAITNRRAFDLLQQMSNGNVSDYDAFWSELRDYRTEVGLVANVVPTDIADLSAFRAPDRYRSTAYADTYLSFRDQAFQFMQSQPVIDIANRQILAPEQASTAIDAFRSGTDSRASLASRLNIAPDNLLTAVDQGRSDLLTNILTGEPFQFGNRSAYGVMTQTNIYNQMPTASHVIPGFGTDGAQALYRDTQALYDRIMAAPVGDPAVIDLAAQWAYRVYNLMPNARGTAGMTHVGLFSLLGSKGFVLGPLNVAPGDGTMRGPLGDTTRVFYPSALDLNAFTTTEADFVERFRNGGYAPIYDLDGRPVTTGP